MPLCKQDAACAQAQVAAAGQQYGGILGFHVVRAIQSVLRRRITIKKSQAVHYWAMPQAKIIAIRHSPFKRKHPVFVSCPSCTPASRTETGGCGKIGRASGREREGGK